MSKIAKNGDIYMGAQTNNNLYIYCGKCYGSECEHIKIIYHDVEHIEKKLFTKNIIHRDSMIGIMCECGHTHCNRLTKDIFNSNLYKCDKCHIKIIVSDAFLTLKCINSIVGGKYPRQNCISCNGSGNVLIDSFRRCGNCEGTGGITCNLCNGNGYKLTNTQVYTPQNNLCQPSYLTCHIDSCVCKNGYVECCKDCGGTKSTKGTPTSMTCNYCIP